MILQRRLGEMEPTMRNVVCRQLEAVPPHNVCGAGLLGIDCSRLIVAAGRTVSHHKLGYLMVSISLSLVSKLFSNLKRKV